MENSNKQMQKEVEKVIEGFISSFIDEYCELKIDKRKTEECHQYVKLRAEKAKQAFLNLLSSDYNKNVNENFKTIENNWLLSIEKLSDFELFLTKINKTL